MILVLLVTFFAMGGMSILVTKVWIESDTRALKRQVTALKETIDDLLEAAEVDYEKIVVQRDEIEELNDEITCLGEIE